MRIFTGKHILDGTAFAPIEVELVCALPEELPRGWLLAGPGGYGRKVGGCGRGFWLYQRGKLCLGTPFCRLIFFLRHLSIYLSILVFFCLCFRLLL